jgi:hypothetical protein
MYTVDNKQPSQRPAPSCVIFFFIILLITHFNLIAYARVNCIDVIMLAADIAIRSEYKLNAQPVSARQRYRNVSLISWY